MHGMAQRGRGSCWRCTGSSLLQIYSTMDHCYNNESIWSYKHKTYEYYLPKIWLNIKYSN